MLEDHQGIDLSKAFNVATPFVKTWTENCRRLNFSSDANAGLTCMVYPRMGGLHCLPSQTSHLEIISNVFKCGSPAKRKWPFFLLSTVYLSSRLYERTSLIRGGKTEMLGTHYMAGLRQHVSWPNLQTMGASVSVLSCVA